MVNAAATSRGALTQLMGHSYDAYLYTLANKKEKKLWPYDPSAENICHILLGSVFKSAHQTNLLQLLIAPYLTYSPSSGDMSALSNLI